jgi:membrane fusion protein
MGLPMSMLFRPQVALRSRQRLDGEVVAYLPLKTSLFGWAGIVVVALAIAASCLASYARRVTVPGLVLPDKGLIETKSPQSGMLQGFRVKVGQLVHAGDPIADLRLPNQTVGGRVDQLTLKQLAAQRDAQQALYAGQLHELDGSVEDLRQQEQSAEAKLEQTRGRIAFLEKTRALSANALQRSRDLLAKGFSTKTKAEQDEQGVAQADLNLSSARSDYLEAQRTLSDIRSQLALTPAKRQQMGAQNRMADADLQLKQVEQRAAGQLVVLAPVTGIVSSLPVNPGQSVDSGDVVAAIVPEHAHLIARLFVPSSASGFVSVGQEVELRYDAFPYETFGTASGTVETVSGSAVSADSFKDLFKGTEPVFTVDVRLDRSFVRAYGKRMPLLPGNKATADIVVERNTLIHWLLDPLYAAGRL